MSLLVTESGQLPNTSAQEQLCKLFSAYKKHKIPEAYFSMMHLDIHTALSRTIIHGNITENFGYITYFFGHRIITNRS